jgi:CBS domain-containing protein
MITAGELCIRQVVICGSGDTVLEAARRMRDHHVGSVIVVADTQGPRKPVGILTDRDVVIGPVAAGQRDLGAIAVGDVMTAQLVTAREDDSVADALKRMRVHGLRRLPVVDGAGELQGLIAFDDLIDFLSEEMTDLAELIARERRREEHPAT